MKKLLLILIVFSSFLYSLNGQVAHIEEEICVDENTRCVFVNYNLGPKIIVLGCEGNYQYSPTNVQVKRVCMGNDAQCYLTVEIFVDGRKVSGDEKRLGKGKGVINIPIDFNGIAKTLGDDFNKNEVSLQVKIKTHCPGAYGNWVSENELDPVTIKIVKPGDHYTSTEYVGTDQNEICGFGNEGKLYKTLNELNKAKVCCVNKVVLTAEITKIDETKIEYTGSVNGGIGYKYFNISFGINGSTAEISQTLDSKSIVKEFTPSENTCIYPGLVELFNKWETWDYKVVCNGPDEKCELLDAYLELFDVDWKACEEYHPCDHHDPDPDFRRIDGNFFREIADACHSSIHMELLNPINDMHYEYTWVGPDGQEYHTQVLDNVPYGKYELTINDECCNEYKYTYELCDSYSYDNWYYNNGEYCCTVTCGCDNTFRSTSNNTYTRCVTPSWYDEDWSFDENIKKCTKHAYWYGPNGVEYDLTDEVNEADIDAEDGNVVKDPIIEEYYDDEEEECIREYFCEEDVSTGYKDQEDPEFGEWGYDDIFKTCFREVFCFGNSDPAKDSDGDEVVDEGEADIEWDFEENDFMCYGIVYCDGNETDNEVEEDPDAEWAWDDDENECITESLSCDDAEQDNISEEASDYGDWVWNEDEVNIVCSRDVYCELADESFIDYTLNNSTICSDDLPNQCDEDEFTWYIKCDGELTEFYYCSDEGPSNKKEDYSNEHKDFEKGNSITLNSNKVIFKQTDKVYKYYKVLVYTVDGRKRKVKGVKRVKDVDRFISYFQKYKAQKNIMYFYTVYGENDLLYSKKFFIARK